jgi:GDPmannose 4,6-dehydratase
MGEAANGAGPRALVTGVAGQDGSYLAELLLQGGYEVHGTVRPGRAAAAPAGISVHEADLLEPRRLREVLEQTRPRELYHLAAPSFVPDSWEDPAQTVAAISGATAALLAGARDVDPRMRVYVATSSAIFGDTPQSPQSETSPVRPTTPYAVAKLAAHLLVGTLRTHFGQHASSGITFNHESPRRPERFLPRKVTRAAARIKLGLEDELVLGDLDAVRDWCHAADVARAAWLMLQRDQPDDYVIAGGVGRTVRELVEVAFGHVGLDPDRHVRVDERFTRAREPHPPVGDATKARRVLGWEPLISFEAMIAEMVDADLASEAQAPTGAASS